MKTSLDIVALFFYQLIETQLLLCFLFANKNSQMQCLYDTILKDPERKIMQIFGILWSFWVANSICLSHTNTVTYNTLHLLQFRNRGWKLDLSSPEIPNLPGLFLEFLNSKFYTTKLKWFRMPLSLRIQLLISVFQGFAL